MTAHLTPGHTKGAYADRFPIGNEAICFDGLVGQPIAESEITFAAAGEQFRVGGARNHLRASQRL